MIPSRLNRLRRVINAMSEKTNELSFEAALAQLEETVASLEAGNLPLDESLALYERGRELATYCTGLLDNAQLKVEQLTEDGEIVDVS